MSEPRAERPRMTDYGVDTPDWEPLPWSWAAGRLERCRNFWLGTVSPGGRPHSMPVWAVWDDDRSLLCFSCAPGARKARNLDGNPHAVVTVDDTVECLSLEGRAARLTDDGRIVGWIDRYLAKYQPLEASLTADFLRSNVLFEFRPERAFAVIERADEFATRATRWRFDTGG